MGELLAELSPCREVSITRLETFALLEIFGALDVRPFRNR